MEKFTEGYIECAIWASTDENDRPLDSIGAGLSDGCLAQMLRECATFQADNAELLDRAGAERDDDQLGHDFWLTRNHHGVGFWDGRLSYEIGQRLTDAAHRAGERTLYVSDAGEIEIGEG